MTFNATYLNSANRDKRLIHRSPLRRVGPADVRQIVTTQEIADLLDGKLPGTAFPHVKTDALVARYIAGYLVYVSLVGTSLRIVDLERLADEDDIWMLCSREPRPGWRLFGRFWQKDKFVALRAYDRHLLPNRKAFHEAALATQQDWDEVVGMPPLRGASVDDYLSGVWRDVDQDTE